jgi:cellulose/xylan binding protein with CBM9 domain
MKDNRLKIVTICCWLLITVCSVVAVGKNVPEVEVRKTITAPVIDGKLNDKCWQNAAEINDFIKFESSAAAKKKTVVLLTYDAKNLYIAFKCYETSTKGIKAKYLKRDNQIWMDDCVEFVLDNNSKLGFYHFILNSKGTIYDDQLEDAQWNCKNISAGTNIEPGYWVVELSIPLKEIGISLKTNKTIGARFARSSRIGKTEHSTFPPISRSLFFRSKLAKIILK